MNENDFFGKQQSPPASPNNMLLENELTVSHIDNTQSAAADAIACKFFFLNWLLTKIVMTYLISHFA